MTVSGKMLTRYLSSRTATESADGQPAALSAPGTSAVSEARGHVTAAARLLPVPWDAALGYGNPRREVRYDIKERMYHLMHLAYVPPQFF